MLYPFIYLRVYYRGFQDSLFPRWPDFLASRGYGGSMATVHRSWLVQGQNFVACTRLLTPTWSWAGQRVSTETLPRLVDAGGLWVFFGKCPICPMLCFFSRPVFGMRMTMTMMIWLMINDDDWWIWIRQEPKPPHFQGGDLEGSWFFTKGHFGSLCGVQRATGLVLVAWVTF